MTVRAGPPGSEKIEAASSRGTSRWTDCETSRRPRSTRSRTVSISVGVDPNDPSVIWVGTGDNIVGCESYFGIGLLRSPNGGTNWEIRNGTGNDTLDGLASFASIAIDPRDSNRIVVGGTRGNATYTLIVEIQ